MSLAHNHVDSSNSKHISNLLRHFLEQHQGDEVCLRDLLNEMGDRAFGPTLLICALPEALPLPVGGISALVGIPLLLVSAQLTIGYRQPRIPRRILEHPFKRQHFEKLVCKSLRHLERLERIFKPRWQFFTNPIFERLLGLLLMLLAVIIALPIPFANMVPAIAIVLICLGMIEQDGLVIAISSAMICVILALAVWAIVTFATLQGSELIDCARANGKKGIAIAAQRLRDAPGFERDQYPDITDRSSGRDIYNYYGYKPYW